MLERFTRLPAALVAASRFERLGDSKIPAMLVHPDWAMARPVPVVVWMHGRTAAKEIDPGRALRLMRAGIGVCAVDLPGHGDRFETAYQQPTHTLDLILRMTDEIDEITEVLVPGSACTTWTAWGSAGMSAGRDGDAETVVLAAPVRVRIGRSGDRGVAVSAGPRHVPGAG